MRGSKSTLQACAHLCIAFASLLLVLRVSVMITTILRDFLCLRVCSRIALSERNIYVTLFLRRYSLIRTSCSFVRMRIQLKYQPQSEVSILKHRHLPSTRNAQGERSSSM